MINFTYPSSLKTFLKYSDKSSSLINRYFMNLNFSPCFNFEIKLSRESHKLFKSCSNIYL